MGTAEAFSPAIVRSAVFTGPQRTLFTNWAHSTEGSPLAFLCCGSELFKGPRAEERIRRPNEPVSTRTPLTFWQLELPGAQTLTVVNTPLTSLFPGQACTVIASVSFPGP